MSDCIKCIHYPICSDSRKFMFKGHAEVCGENFEVEAHDEQIRADERGKVLDRAYNILANELMWVLHSCGDDVYINIGDSIRTTFNKILEEGVKNVQ